MRNNESLITVITNSDETHRSMSPPPVWAWEADNGRGWIYSPEPQAGPREGCLRGKARGQACMGGSIAMGKSEGGRPPARPPVEFGHLPIQACSWVRVPRRASSWLSSRRYSASTLDCKGKNPNAFSHNNQTNFLFNKSNL